MAHNKRVRFHALRIPSTFRLQAEHGTLPAIGIDSVSASHYVRANGKQCIKNEAALREATEQHTSFGHLPARSAPLASL